MGLSFKAAAPPKVEVPPAPEVARPPKDAQDILGNSGVSALISAAGTRASQAKESVTPTLNQAGKKSPGNASGAKKPKGKKNDAGRTVVNSLKYVPAVGGVASKAADLAINHGEDIKNNAGKAARQGGALVESTVDHVIKGAADVLTGDHAKHLETVRDALDVLREKDPRRQAPSTQDLEDKANVQEIAVDTATRAQDEADSRVDQAKDQVGQAKDAARKQVQQAADEGGEQARQAEEQARAAAEEAARQAQEAADEAARQAQEAADEAARQAQEAADEATRQAEEAARRAQEEAANAAADPGGTVNDVVNTVSSWHP